MSYQHRLALVVIAAVEAAINTAAENEAENAVNNLCSEAKYLKALSLKIAILAPPGAGAAEANRKAARLWRLAAAADKNPKTTAVYTALALHAESTAERQASDVAAYTKAAAAADKLIARRIDALLNARNWPATVNLATDGASSSAAATCTHSVSWQTTEAGACDVDAIKTAEHEGHQVDKEGNGKVKLITANQLGDLKKRDKVVITFDGSIDNAAANKCKTGTTSRSLNTIAFSNAAGDVRYAAELAETDIHKRPGNKCTALDDDSLAKAALDEQLKVALCRLRQHRRPETKIIEQATVKDLTESSEFRSIAANTLAGVFGAEIPKTTDFEPKAKKLILDAYGAEHTKLAEKFVDTIKDKTVRYTNGGETTTDSLNNIAGAAAYLQALAYLEGQNMAAELKSQQEKKTQVAETDETCQKRGKKDNCKDGCKWEGTGENKKCVVDKTYTAKQVEGGEKKLTKCSDATTEE
uniref:Variant surface glycoprotein 1155 n=1 Tax=Trypanosoma brucei TaxID=5691 RepID=M4SVN1_9TRYP|nr:variant surface glycoprotein 1155 [Trypanosoma brucei]